MTTHERTFDAVIVGAGPAGAAAAHALADAGGHVALVDKATFPRDKFCGDGLTTLALRQLDEIGFAPTGITSWTPVEAAVLRSPHGRRIDIPLPSSAGTYAAIARRYEFDHALVELAVGKGAVGRFGAGVTRVDPRSDRVTVTLSDGEELQSRTLIAADGMWSTTRKLLGLSTRGYRGEWHAFRQYFEHVGAAANELWVWFEPDVLPGYVWSFPVGDGRANVGFGILRGGGIPIQRMKTLWPELLARPHIRAVLGSSATPESPHRAWPIPARIGSAALIGPRTLFVGDAAAACDVLTGEGIGQALLTGRLAARALVDHDRSFTEAARSYEAAVRSELVADHRLATGLSRLMARPRIAETALRLVDTSSWSRRNFGRWMFEDYPRAILSTPGRWQRGILSAPGAFREV